MPSNQIERRIRRYAALKTVIDEKGRLPFYKNNQKFAKLMMFMYETLYEMASKTGLQNNNGVLYKISFLAAGFKAGMPAENRIKVLFEYAIRPGSCRMKSFEFQHTNKTEFICAIKTFAEYYGLSFSEGEEKYTRTAKDHSYAISLPEEA